VKNGEKKKGVLIGARVRCRAAVQETQKPRKIQFSQGGNNITTYKVRVSFRAKRKKVCKQKKREKKQGKAGRRHVPSVPLGGPKNPRSRFRSAEKEGQ